VQRIGKRKTSICTPYVFMCFQILFEGEYWVLLSDGLRKLNQALSSLPFLVQENLSVRLMMEVLM
jgi:hypothetical protein